MGIEAIVAAIARETDATVTAVTSESEQQVGRIRDEAAHEAAEIERTAAHALDRAAAAGAEGTINQARLRADRGIRAAREAAFMEAVSRLEARMRGLRNDPAYAQMMLRLITECRAVLPDASIVTVAREDVELVRRMVGDELRVQLGPDGWGGAVLTADDGRYVDNRIEARLERAVPHLRRLFTALVPLDEEAPA